MKEAVEPFVEKSQQPPTSSAVVLTATISRSLKRKWLSAYLEARLDDYAPFLMVGLNAAVAYSWIT